WTVVTSCTRALALVRLRVARLPVPEKMITSTDIVNGKPHPEPYLKGAGVLGIPSQECVVFEDAPAAIRAAKAAHTPVIAFQTTERDDLLRDAGADWIVKDASAVRVTETNGRDGISILLRSL